MDQESSSFAYTKTQKYFQNNLPLRQEQLRTLSKQNTDVASQRKQSS